MRRLRRRGPTVRGRASRKKSVELGGINLNSDRLRPQLNNRRGSGPRLMAEIVAGLLVEWHAARRGAP
jgi:hypothetical protein